MHDKSDVSESFTRLVTLFQSELEEVRFPGVDVEILKDAAGRHRGCRDALAAAEEQLAAARASLEDEQRTLAELMERGLAYARVYAEGDPELLDKLAAVSPKRRAAKRTRSRKADKAKAKPLAEGAQPIDIQVAKAG